MKTDKPTKKRVTYNEEVLKTLLNKYGFSLDYIRKCIRGDRTGIMPDKIKSDYNTLVLAASTAIQRKAVPQKI